MIELRNIYKFFGDVLVLSIVSFPMANYRNNKYKG